MHTAVLGHVWSMALCYADWTAQEGAEKGP